MAIRTVTPYAGNLPDIAQGQAAFDAAVNTLLPYLTSVMPGGINNTVADINAFASTLGALSSVILNGTGSPSSIVGQDGNYYIDTANGDLYYKTSGAWELKGNLKGPAGSNPSTQITNALFGVWSSGTLESAVSSVNMIINGEEHTGASGATPATGWTQVNSPTFLIDTSTFVNGSASLKITNNGATQGMQTIAMTTVVGRVYKLACWAKCGTATLASLYAGTTPGGYDIGLTSVGATSWTRNEHIFEAVGTTTYVSVANNATSGGTAWYDSITLYDMGANLVTNGTFNTDASGWLSYGAGSIVPVTGGINGNCAQVTVVPSGYSYRQITGLTVGKLYRFCGWLKNGAGTGPMLAFSHTGPGVFIETTFNGALTSLPNWTFYSGIFEATATTGYVNMSGSSASSFLFDSITLTEVTVGCVDYNSKALDLWTKDAAAQCWRETIDVKEGSYYALRVYNGAVYWSDGQRSAKPEFYRKYAGRQAVVGCWVKSTTASKARIGITDSAGTTWSSYHTGGGAWEWLEVTRTPAANITSYQIVLDSGTATEAWFSQPQLQFGTAIGQGNYVPREGEVVALESAVSSSALPGTKSSATLVSIGVLADSQGKIPRSAKRVSGFSNISDTGGAGAYLALNNIQNIAECYIYAITTGNTFGLFDVALSPDGIFKYSTNATGTNTLTIGNFNYRRVQL